MSVKSERRSSGSVFTLLAALVLLAHSGMSGAQSRSFQTGLYVSYSDPGLPKADADLPMFGEGQPQPPGLSIMLFKSWNYDTPILPTENYDWSRVVAALVDEPYLTAVHAEYGDNGNTNPCFSLETDAVANAAAHLATAASALKSVAPLTRLWVNFNADSEVDWMMDPICPLLLMHDYMDVVSLDAYWRPFNASGSSDYVKRYYDWIVAHRATPQQQIALIPGTFFRDGIDSQSTQTGYFPGYFDYANSANQTCNLPLGSRGVTGVFDGCLVWIVLGFSDDTFIDGATYRGERDPLSTVISAAWRAELALPIRSDLAYKLTRLQTFAMLIPQWLNN